MKISALPLLAALGVFGFAGAFVWAAVRPITPDAAEADGKRVRGHLRWSA